MPVFAPHHPSRLQFNALSAGLCRAIALTSCLLTAPAYSQTSVTPAQLTWQAATLESSWQFDIKANSNAQVYRVWLYLPQKAAPAEGYPVLWALDGNASFAALRNAHLQQLSKAAPGYQDGVIVAIGVPADTPFAEQRRSYDYTPYQECSNCPASTLKYGGAEPFQRFISEQLRPLLAAKIHLNPTRQSLFGFSYGGLFASYILLTKPELFQAYWITSPSLWFNQHQLLQQAQDIMQQQVQLASPLRVALNVGYEEEFPPPQTAPARAEKLKQRQMLSNLQTLARLLEQRGQTQLSLSYPGARDHGDMFDYACRHVSTFAFSQ